MSITGLYYILITINFLAALMAVLYYRKRNKILLPVVVLLVAVFFSVVAAFLTGKYLRDNRAVNHFINPILMAGWGLFFYTVLEDPRVKKYTQWATIILILYSIISTSITGLTDLPWHVMKAATIFNLILGGLLLMQMLDLPSRQNIFTNSFFLIALAVVWFNMISSLNYFLYDFSEVHRPARQIIRHIHWYSNYIYYSILAVAMFFQTKLNKDV